MPLSRAESASDGRHVMSMFGPSCNVRASLVTWDVSSRELERSAAAAKRAAGPANTLLERLSSAVEATDAQAAQAREAATAARQQLQEAVAAQRYLLTLCDLLLLPDCTIVWAKCCEVHFLQHSMQRVARRELEKRARQTKR